jgi:hypothetical protein
MSLPISCLRHEVLKRHREYLLDMSGGLLPREMPYSTLRKYLRLHILINMKVLECLLVVSIQKTSEFFLHKGLMSLKGLLWLL